jgi:hypothetical protein
MSVNLKSIEARLNADPEFQSEFRKDPVGLLGKEGLVLSEAMAENLRSFVSSISSGAQPQVPGSTVGASRQEAGISISIGKSF